MVPGCFIGLMGFCIGVYSTGFIGLIVNRSAYIYTYILTYNVDMDRYRRNTEIRIIYRYILCIFSRVPLLPPPPPILSPLGSPHT